jgi:hypothetical protein
MMRIENLNSLRVIILPVEVIGERYTVQRRTHRKKRTNKKWKKRYGVAVRYKDRVILDNISRVVYMTEKMYERMKRS